VYSPTLDSPVRFAKDLFERIEAGDVSHGMKTRDIWRKGWQSMTTAEELREIVDILEEHGWVRRVIVKPSGAGRPSERIHLHPGLRD
jgi:hypothetical protein